jgi:isoleucyl-tRNA synthetase
VDRWALHRLTEVIARTTRAYEEFEFHRVYYTLHQFCAVDLSQFYLDHLKDRLYVSAADDPGRRAAQTVLYHLARTLAGLLAPVLSHTAEEVWRHLPGDKPPSIQLTDWPAADESWRDPELGLRWERFFALRDEVAKALEEAKAGSVIRQPMEAAVTIYGDADDSRLLASFGGELARLLIVSAAEVRPAPDGPPANVYQSSVISGFGVEVKAAGGQKCARCWLYRTTVGADAEHPQLCDRCAATVRAVDAG